jgi:hypothetical protein
MRKRSYIIMGSHNPNTAEQISAFRVTPPVIECIAKQWKHQFPYVSYIAVNHKHSAIHFESEEKI